MSHPFIAVLQEAVQEIAETMLFIEVVPGETANQCAALPDACCAVIGYSGALTGQMRLGGTKAAALKLGGALLGEERDELDADMKDAFAEMGNMIAGGVQTRLEAEMGAIQISPPEVVESDGEHLHCNKDMACVSHLFEMDGVTFFAEIFYVDSAANDAADGQSKAQSSDNGNEKTLDNYDERAPGGHETASDHDEEPSTSDAREVLDRNTVRTMLREVMGDTLRKATQEMAREEIKESLPDVAERLVLEEIERLKQTDGSS
ncbi:MAG: chemotaxis protein CheX [Magnetococcales bacterium]|nr:chemotaxis protein CheX [Magnetococcales bacterium]